MNKPSQDLENINLDSPRLESRLNNFMDSITEHPNGSILEATGSRGQAKAAYRMLANEKFDIAVIKKEYALATMERIREYNTILIIQDTTTNNLNGHKKTKCLGWCDEFNQGALIHTCLATTTDGVPLGILHQKTYTRPQRKDDSATKSTKNKRPIEEKESNRWLETMTEANKYIPLNVNAIHICDREGDFYEFYSHALANDSRFIIRVSQNRIIQEHQKIFDYIKTIPSCGEISICVPRDTRKGVKARTAILEVRFASITFQKPQDRKEEFLPPEITATIVHVVETEPPAGIEPIEWYLMTTEKVGNFDDAVRVVNYYVGRWKIERFHYVLKSGCEVEKVQERTFDRQSSLIFLYSMVAIYIMALTYLAREAPDTLCSAMFDEEEWKILYCAANKTSVAPDKPYTLKEAVKYLARLGAFSGTPSDKEPGVKVVWRGLSVLFTLVEYHNFI